MSVPEPLQHLHRLAARTLGQLARLPVHLLMGRSAEHGPRAPGLAPGTLYERTGAAATRFTAIRYSRSGFEKLADTAPEALSSAREPGSMLWIDVAGLADLPAIRKLGKLFDIHRLTIADVVNTPQRPKAQRIGEQRLVITQLPHFNSESGASELGQLALIIGSDYLITFREHPGDLFKPIFERMRIEDSRIRGETVDYLAYAVLDLAVDSFYPVVESLSDQIGELEEEALENAGSNLLNRIHGHRHSLILMARVLWRNRDMVNTLLRSEDLFPARLHLYLQDMHDHSIQLLDMVETIRELATSLVEIHLAMTGNRANQVMKTLTIMASIFIPLTFVAGIYGMNFEHMPELAYSWAYPAVLGVMLAVAVGLLFWFWHRGWIGR